MKKFYTLLSVVFALSVNAQVSNGDLETWVDSSTPANFTASPYTANVTQESTTIHGGTYSAKHTTAATSSVKIQNETAVITPGNNYTISYWFLDNDPLAKSRPWIYWITSAGTTITDASSDAAFRPALYSDDSPQWVHYTATYTAPATTAKLRFEMRTYAVGTGLGSVYYDDMSVVDNGVLSVQQNEISGLSMYPNPVTNGNLYITSKSNQAKSVTIFDVLGKQVVKTTTVNNAVNVSSLKGGVYFVSIAEDGKTATRKLIIK